jgi:hypothetical protein
MTGEVMECGKVFLPQTLQPTAKKFYNIKHRTKFNSCSMMHDDLKVEEAFLANSTVYCTEVI